jgi:hypothetical protein
LDGIPPCPAKDKDIEQELTQHLPVYVSIVSILLQVNYGITVLENDLFVSFMLFFSS